MCTLQSLRGDTREVPLYRAITLFCARRGMHLRTFGGAAFGDPDFVDELGLGRVLGRRVMAMRRDACHV